MGGYKYTSIALTRPENISIDLGDIIMVIAGLEFEHSGRIDKKNSKMIIGSDERERVIPLDLSRDNSYLLRGYSLIIDKNLEVIIRDSSERYSNNFHSEPFHNEPPFIRRGITGIFNLLDPKKEKPSEGLIDHVESTFRDYYSKKFKDS